MYRTVADPDLQIRGGGGGGHPDPEIRGGGGGGEKKLFGPSALSLVSPGSATADSPRAYDIVDPLRAYHLSSLLFLEYLVNASMED